MSKKIGKIMTIIVCVIMVTTALTVVVRIENIDETNSFAKATNVCIDYQMMEIIKKSHTDLSIPYAPVPKRIMILRVYFNDYVEASRYTKAEVEGFMVLMDQLWRDTSYNSICVDYQVSSLFQLPGDRSEYIDDYATGDKTSGGELTKLLEDAIDNSPVDEGLDWTNLDSIFVLMAETDPAQFHRGVQGDRNLPQGPGGPVELTPAGAFSENPSQNDKQVWGRWAHEFGHAFQQGGPAHPSNYNSEFELMDSNYPGQTGVFEKQDHIAFPGWLPMFKYLEFSQTSGGGIANIWAMEYDPSDMVNVQAVKAKITDDLYYLISVRRRILGDDLNGDYCPACGIPDEGVLIERVSEGADPWVTVKGKGGNRNVLWKEGDSYSDVSDGITISIVKKIDEDNYQIYIQWNDAAMQPDVSMEPWRSPPGNTWETTDIWFDSPVNGYDAYRYGTWNDLTGNPVPRGNGDPPAVGQINRVYARIRNIGTSTATDVVVNFEITDPLGVGIQGPDSFVALGNTDKNDFPGLASIAAGDFEDVFIEWTPDIVVPEEDLEDGLFAFHSCVRVIIDHVAGEHVFANQDGDEEQENIKNFQAVPEDEGGSGAPFDDVITLKNDDSVNPKHFYLSYKSDLPDTWELDINSGNLDFELAPSEMVEIPIFIKQVGSVPLGSVFNVDIKACSERELVNDLDPNDIHIESYPLGGVQIEVRVLRQPDINIINAEQTSNGIRIEGKFEVDEFSRFYNPDNPFRVMIEGVDSDRSFLTDTANVIKVDSFGRFEGFIYTSLNIYEVVCLFAGTKELASAFSGFAPIEGPTDLTITCPRDGFYLFGSKILPIPGIIPGLPVSIVIGSVDIVTGVTGISNVEHVWFTSLKIFTKDQSEFTDYSPPFEWSSWSVSSGIYIIAAVAYDKNDNELSTDMVGLLKI